MDTHICKWLWGFALFGVVQVGGVCSAQVGIEALKPIVLVPGAEKLKDSWVGARQVRLEVQLGKVGPYTIPGRQRVFGAAALVAHATEDTDPYYVTAELLIRGAKEIRIVKASKTFLARVVYVDSDRGLAILSSEPESAEGLQSAGASPLTVWESTLWNGEGVAGVWLRSGHRALDVKIGPHGDEGLEYYRALSDTLPLGTPIFGASGGLLGVLALRRLSDNTCWVVFADEVGAFLKGFADPSERRDTPYEVRATHVPLRLPRYGQ